MEFEKVVLLACKSAPERNKIARRFEEERNKVTRSFGEREIGLLVVTGGKE